MLHHGCSGLWIGDHHHVKAHPGRAQTADPLGPHNEDVIHQYQHWLDYQHPQESSNCPCMCQLQLIAGSSIPLPYECDDWRFPRWITEHHSPQPQLRKAIHSPHISMVQRLPSLLWEQAVQQSPICCWNGFLDFNNPPYGWGESDRLSTVSTHNLSFLCYSPSVASSFLIASHYTHLPLLSIGLILPSLDYAFLSSTQSVFNLDTIHAISFVYSYDTSSHALAYKPVAKKVHSVITPVDEEFYITQTLLDNLLSGLVPLPLHPLDFIPGEHCIQGHADNLDLNPTNWLWPEKVKLIHWIVHKHEKAFAWVPTKWGHLDKWYFPPVKIPTIPHTPWVL